MVSKSILSRFIEPIVSYAIKSPTDI